MTMQNAFSASEKDLWEHLERVEGPIVLYGMGDGADKLLDVCKRKEIEIAGVFASDGFVRGQSFRGFTVTSYGALKEKYGKMTVLVAFASSLPDVMANIDRIASEQETYLPDLPVAGGELFDFDFYEAHFEEFSRAHSLFEDERSRNLFDSMVEYKLTGRREPLVRDCETREGEFSLLHPETYRLALDLGAYTGDTAEELLLKNPECEVIALEPDPRTFKKLCERAERLNHIHPLHAGAWSECRELPFSASGNRGSRKNKNAKTVPVPFVTPDSVAEGKQVDYLKFDVEGAEYEALLGCREILSHSAPEIFLSLYHKSGDLFRLPLLLHELNPDYSMYLRREKGYPAWDLNLIAVKKR